MKTTSLEDLQKITEELSPIQGEAETKDVREPITKLKNAALKVGESFSGSWIGYHANVYYRNFNSPPSGAHFSQDWGLKDMRISSLGTSGDWVEYDYEVVKEKVYELSGNVDLTLLRSRAKQLEALFNRCKDDFLSVLSLELAVDKDTYLDKIKKDVEALEYLTTTELLQKRNPSRNVTTRDAVAASQGARAPVHERVLTEAIEIHNAFALPCELKELVEKAQKHLVRKVSIAKAAGQEDINLSQSSLVVAGGAFDAFVAISKVLEKATIDVMIIDPYMDAKTLTDYATSIPETVKTIRLLAGDNSHKRNLKPAVSSWISQNGSKQALDARLAPAKSLHDRLILVDKKEVWLLSQSLNAFAARAHASIVRLEDNLAAMKIDLYEQIWTSATVLQ